MITTVAFSNKSNRQCLSEIILLLGTIMKQCLTLPYAYFETCFELCVLYESRRKQRKF